MARVFQVILCAAIALALVGVGAWLRAGGLLGEQTVADATSVPRLLGAGAFLMAGVFALVGFSAWRGRGRVPMHHPLLFIAVMGVMIAWLFAPVALDSVEPLIASMADEPVPLALAIALVMLAAIAMFLAASEALHRIAGRFAR